MTIEETKPIAIAAARDHGNFHMKAGRREIWNDADFAKALAVYEKTMRTAAPLEVDTDCDGLS